MNVQNAMAAAAAAFAAGASLHDIRQGLRSFSTNYYLSPGRLNEVQVEGRTVIVDYAHNAPGLRMLGDFVDKTAVTLDKASELGKVSRIGVIATAGDRRDADMRELGAIAAHHFDVVIVREDISLRGRRRGAVADLIAEGVHAAMGEGVRAKQVEIILDELEATRHAIARSNPGDLIVVCVDQHASVMSELESYGRQAQPGARRDDHASTNAVSDPDFVAGPAEAEPGVEPPLF
jgi:cyanophycin synthetase